MRKTLSFLSICLLVVFLTTLLVSGCAQKATPTPTAVPTAAPTAAPTATPKPALTPTPTPTAAPTAAPTPTATPKPTPTATPTPTPAWPKAISIASGPIGGTYYVLGTGMAAMIQKYVGINCTGEATGGDEVRFQLLRDRQVELSFEPYGAVKEAWAGTGAFKDRMTFTRTFHTGHGSMMTIVARASANIKTPADFVGKRVIWDYVTSSLSMALTGAILEAYNLKKTDFTVMKSVSREEDVAALKEGRADASIFWGAIPTAAVVEVTSAIDCNLVDIDKVDEVVKRPGGSAFSPSVVPAGTYKGQTKDIRLGINITGLQVHKDVDKELVYQICKALFDHPDELGAIHPAAKEYIPKNAFRAYAAPYHEGVVRYYKEKGVWTAEMEKWQTEILKGA